MLGILYFFVLDFPHRGLVQYVTIKVIQDRRDNKTYTVARLADGNIWMTQNLDHDIGDIEGGTYTSNDTDLPSGASWTPTGSGLTKPTNDTSWTSSNTAPQSYDPGNLYWNGIMPGDQATCDAVGGMWHDMLGCLVNDLSSSTGNSHYHLSDYYNWTAAVAMSDSSSVAENTTVNQSICPAGWRLPTKTGNKSFENLITKAGPTSGPDGNIQNSPTYFTYGGSWRGTKKGDAVGLDGEYWSSVVQDSSHSWVLGFDGPLDNLEPTTVNTYRYTGYSVRCVARSE